MALILALSALPAGWLMFVMSPQPLDVMTAWRAFRLATLLVALAAIIVRRMLPSSLLAVPLFLATLSALVIAADQWFGGPIETGVFSYSVAAGSRYYGLGNESAAILVGASIAAVALAADSAADRPAIAAATRRFGLPLVGIVVVITAAAPFAVRLLVVFAVRARLVLEQRRSQARMPAPQCGVSQPSASRGPP